PAAAATPAHFRPVGNAAPPRPTRSEATSSSTTAFGPSRRARRRALRPPLPSYAERSSGSTVPQRRSSRSMAGIEHVERTVRGQVIPRCFADQGGGGAIALADAGKPGPLDGGRLGEPRPDRFGSRQDAGDAAAEPHVRRALVRGEQGVKGCDAVELGEWD